MVDNNTPHTPPRVPGVEPGARNETHIHTPPSTPRPEKRSNTALAFIVGGVAVGLVILYFLFDGFGTNNAAPTSSGAVDSSTSITVEPGTSTTETAPAPEPEAAPQAPAATDDAGEAAPEPAPAD
ncbi:hypothetical protein [Roseinatronobacter sp.]|uniref:hypothetical protein n=1 Tax=Roseinatronobacter sp. TaxID=1945755 RepID=UPI0025CC792C|nr:hypothetical protein [Rhodobaca sp.]